MDKLYHKAEATLNTWKEHHAELQTVLDQTKILEDFYHSDEWITGREAIQTTLPPTETFYTASEDAIWNLSQTLYEEKIKLLKTIIATL